MSVETFGHYNDPTWDEVFELQDDVRDLEEEVYLLQLALKAVSIHNFGDEECWCSEDYCCMLPSPGGHSYECDAIRAVYIGE